MPRSTVGNLARLMDEMVTALARCKQPKLKARGGAQAWRGQRTSACLHWHPVAPVPMPLRLPLGSQPRVSVQVLMFPWWRHRKTAFTELFHSYESIPAESRDMLQQYYNSRQSMGQPLSMYPPGRVLFLRPIKTQQTKEWDAVWIQPEDLIGGIGTAARWHAVQPLPCLTSSCRRRCDHVLQLRACSSRHTCCAITSAQQPLSR